MSRMDHLEAGPILAVMNAGSKRAAWDAIEMFLKHDARLDAGSVSDDLISAFMDCVRGYDRLEESHNAAEYLAEVSREYADEVCDRMTE